MWPLAVASRAFRPEVVVCSLGSEGDEVSGGGGLSVVWRVVVTGDARFVIALVVTAVGAPPNPRAGGLSRARLVEPDLAVTGETPSTDIA